MRVKLLLLTIFILMLSGCGRPPNFYMLTPKADIKIGENTKGKTIIGVATVEIPEYLNRKEILTRVSATKLSIHNSELWASNLAENIQNVLKIDLSAKTDRYTFLSYPWEEPIDDIYRIYLTIDSFDMDEQCSITISGRWSIVDMSSRSIKISKEFGYSEVAPSCDYASMVDVTSEIIDRISNRIIRYLIVYKRNIS